VKIPAPGFDAGIVLSFPRTRRQDEPAIRAKPLSRMRHEGFVTHPDLNLFGQVFL
jgi:hypothetical protein